MQAIWEPDADNVYLSSGTDNLALHQITPGESWSYRPLKGSCWIIWASFSRIPEAVDRMYREIETKDRIDGGRIAKAPKQHRDGSYSFYFSDPDGNLIQALYEPTISNRDSTR